MCAPTHKQLQEAGWFGETTPNPPLSVPPLRLAQSAEALQELLAAALKPFAGAVGARMRQWFPAGFPKEISETASEGGPTPAGTEIALVRPHIIACSLDALIPGIRFDVRLLQALEEGRFLDRGNVGDVPAPKVFGVGKTTADIMPSCSLEYGYQNALERVHQAPKAERAQLLDEVREWPSQLLRGMSVRVLALATQKVFQSSDVQISDNVLGLLVACQNLGSRLCITSSINVWAARWLVAERLNPLIESAGGSAIPLSCVGGVSSSLRAESGLSVSEEDLSRSLAKYTSWNASAFGPLVVTDDVGATAAVQQQGRSERDIALALVGPEESTDMYARASHMIALCDVTTSEQGGSDFITRMSTFPKTSWVVQPMRGSSFLSDKGL